jgi:RNA polymerase sigma-70 factor, ECF subfamily
MTPRPRPRVRPGSRRSHRKHLSVAPGKDLHTPSEASPSRATIGQGGLSEDLQVLLPRLWRFALRLAGDRRDAEDLVQRACARALERRDPLQPGTSTISWMFSIVHSVWLNELRARQIRSHGNMQWSENLLEAAADPVAGNPEMHSLHRQIISSVEKLPDAQRSVMLLMAVEGLSYREAATILEVPIGTVMSRLACARLSIGESLAAE